MGKRFLGGVGRQTWLVCPPWPYPGSGTPGCSGSDVRCGVRSARCLSLYCRVAVAVFVVHSIAVIHRVAVANCILARSRTSPRRVHQVSRSCWACSGVTSSGRVRQNPCVATWLAFHHGFAVAAPRGQGRTDTP